MQTNSQAATGERQFELRSGQFTLPNLRLTGTDMEQLADQLLEQVQRAPDFFNNAPVVIDLSALADVEVDFALLVGLMRGNGMVPVGVRGGSPAQQEMAELMELAVLSEGRPRPRPARPPAATAARPASQPARLIERPVRSGQRVYAPGGDLIVLAPVSNGAEVLADGNIHLYAPLRGRALAGVKGRADARIFCQQLQAELVAVAGHYRTSEQLPEEHLGQPVQIALHDKRLVIESL